MNSHEYGKTRVSTLKNANTKAHTETEWAQSYTQCDLKEEKKGLHWLQTDGNWHKTNEDIMSVRFSIYSFPFEWYRV